MKVSKSVRGVVRLVVYIPAPLESCHSPALIDKRKLRWKASRGVVSKPERAGDLFCVWDGGFGNILQLLDVVSIKKLAPSNEALAIGDGHGNDLPSRRRWDGVICWGHESASYAYSRASLLGSPFTKHIRKSANKLMTTAKL